MALGDRRRGSVAQLTAATYLSLAFGIISGPLTARALGPSGRGELAIAAVSSAILTIVGALGMAAAVTHALANRLESEPSLLGAALRYCALATPVCAVIAFAAVKGPLSDMSSSGRVGTFAVLVTVPIAILQNCMLAILMTRGQLRSLAIMKILPVALTATGTVILFILDDLTVGSALAVFVVTPFLTLPVLWGLCGVRPSHAARLGPLVRFGSRGTIGSLAGLTNARLDQLLIVPVLGTDQLGFYALAVSIALLPLGVSEAITSRAVAAITADSGPHRDQTASRYVRLTVAASLLACGVLAIVGPLLIPLVYGAQFRPSVVPLLLLLPGTVLMCTIMMTGGQLTVFGRPGASSIAELAGVVVTVAGLAMFLSSAGIKGAALVSCVAYAVTLAIELLVLHRRGLRRFVPTLRDFAEIGRDVVHQSTAAARWLFGRVSHAS